ncbi:hypothetical protein GW755_00475 [bacterium]|nr:hypothetical protein [bacterium]
MKLKIIKKYLNLSETFIERRMPSEGKISVKIGDNVNSYDQIGEATYSTEVEKIPYIGSVEVKEGDRVYPSDILAKQKKYVVKKLEYRTKISGLVTEIDKKLCTIEVKSLPKKFDLISGVTGEVVDVINNTSVLIKSPSSVVRGVAGGGEEVAGEITVLKDSDLIDERLINEGVAGKIVFANRITVSAIKKAKTLGCVGFVIASCDYIMYTNSLKENVSLIVTEGFGNLKFNSYLLQLLDQLTSKFAILRTYEKSLVLPVDKVSGKFYFPANRVEEFEAEAKIGDRVYVLNRELFGAVGKITKIIEYEEKVEIEVLGTKKDLSKDLVALVG